MAVWFLTVVCRIGSLESFQVLEHGAEQVVCRIGSLERNSGKGSRKNTVVCRIGSLENQRKRHRAAAQVVCRIGSLEKRVRLVNELLYGLDTSIDYEINSKEYSEITADEEEEQ